MMRKSLLQVLVLVLVVLLATACQSQAVDDNGNNTDDGAEQPIVKTDSGRFWGLSEDSTVIAVKISGVPEELPPREFTLGSELQQQVSEYQLEQGDPVLFKYQQTEDGGQPEILELSLLFVHQDEEKVDSGRFVGLIDSNFVAVHIAGTPEELGSREFMLSQQLKDGWNDLGVAEGDEIVFRYVINEQEQAVITSIKKLHEQPVVFQDSGSVVKLTGQDQLEIHISGTPLALGSKVFKIAPEVREEVSELQLESGDTVRFSYIREGEALVIVALERITEEGGQ